MSKNGKPVAIFTGGVLLLFFLAVLAAMGPVTGRVINSPFAKASSVAPLPSLQAETASHANRSDADPNIVGNIFEFVVDEAIENPVQSNIAGQPPVVMEVMDPSLEQFATLWQKEIGRRFSNAVGVLCHGGEFIEDQWIVGSPTYGRPIQTADSLVAHFQAKYPGRTIVLLACNPGHLHLNIPGVYHATDSVWCIPDREVQGHSEDALTKL